MPGPLGLSGALALPGLLAAYERDRRLLRPAFPEDRRWARTGRGDRPVDVLLLGFDDAAGGLEAVPSGSVAIARIAGDRRRVDVVSVPHTTVVSMPGDGDRPVADAVVLGGVPLAVACVEGLLRVRIDHVVVVPLGALEALTDAVGGVPMRLPSTGDAGTAGEAHRLVGAEVVALLRDADGPAADRVDLEHAYLRGLTRLLLDEGHRLPGNAVRALALGVIPRVATDPGLDGRAAARLAVALRRIRSGDVHAHRVPSGARLEALRGALRDDDLGRLDLEGGD